MNKKFCAVAALVAALGAGTSSATAQDELTGDTRLSCEAVLCLSSGTRPSECAPSLSRYFGIHKKKFSDTLRARQDFLNQCPAASSSPEMQSLVSAIARGAGRCDAASLNATLRRWTGGDEGTISISNQMPDYCAAYTGHIYTDFHTGGFMPQYVGTPEHDGYWVEAPEYEQALAEYQAQHP